MHAFATQALGADGAKKDMLYLPTSPEFDCKKLLAAGEEKIFTLAKSFRNREEGPLHSREFIMLEWYRAGASLGDLIQDCIDFVQEISRATASTKLVYKNQSADPFVKAEVLTLADAFKRYAKIDLDEVIDATATGSAMCWRNARMCVLLPTIRQVTSTAAFWSRRSSRG